MYNMWSGGMMIGQVIWILLLVIIIWVVFQILYKNRNTPKIKTESVMDILEKRYAKGEITKEEFEQMKRNLL